MCSDLFLVLQQYTLTLVAFTAPLHEGMFLWTSIRRVGVEAEAQERSPVPPRDDDADQCSCGTVIPSDQLHYEAVQGTPAYDQDGRDHDKDKHTGSDMDTLHGATSLVSMFGKGWLGSQVFHVLYNEVASKPVHLDKTSVTAVTTFKRAFCKRRVEGKYVWNRNLSANLEQLAEVRRHFAKHHVTLSDDAARSCLWMWIYNFRFTEKQRELQEDKQQSFFDHILEKELGCRQRTLQVIKLGTAGLANDIVAKGEEAVLASFIAYICRIEKEVDENTQRGRDLHCRQRAERGDAQERAHSPHDKGTKPNAKGEPLNRAYEQPAKGKGKGAKNEHGTPDRGCRHVVHPPCDKQMKPKSTGSPSIPAHMPEQHAQGKSKGAKDKQESVGRGCQDVRKTPWKGTGDADAAKRKRRGREDNDKRSAGRVEKRPHLAFVLNDEDLEADKTKHARKRAL